MLDTEKLPQTPTAEKAVWSRGSDGWIFGSMHVDSLQQVMETPKERGIEHNHPEIYKVFIRDNKQPVFPMGWDKQTWWFSDDYNVVAFVGFRLIVKHGLDIFKRGKGISPMMGYLLAGYLQLGESINFRNFQNYLHGRDLKFLPFAILPEHFALHVYMPSYERIAQGIETLKRVLSDIDGIRTSIPSIISDAYALVRLDEVSGSSKLVAAAQTDISERLEKQLGPLRKKLGFVYADLKGSQSVQEFFYEILAKEES